MKFKRLAGCVTMTFVLSLQIGCSTDDRISLTGDVTLDGQPLEEAELFFLHETGGSIHPLGVARTTVSGRFEVPTMVPSGQYRIVIRKQYADERYQQALSANEDHSIDDTQLAAAVAAKSYAARQARRTQGKFSSASKQDRVPECYSNADTTPLRFDLDNDNCQNMELRLTSEKRVAADQTSPHQERS